MEHSNSIRAANVLKDAGQRRASAVAHIFDGPQAATHLATGKLLECRRTLHCLAMALDYCVVFFCAPSNAHAVCADEANINFPAVAELIRQHLTEDALEQVGLESADVPTLHEPLPEQGITACSRRLRRRLMQQPTLNPARAAGLVRGRCAWTRLPPLATSASTTSPWRASPTSAALVQPLPYSRQYSWHIRMCHVLVPSMRPIAACERALHAACARYRNMHLSFRNMHLSFKLHPLCHKADSLPVHAQHGVSATSAAWHLSALLMQGKWMYEVILGTCGIQQIGWATLQCPFTSEEGVGDAPDSYAWDGKRVQRWNVSPHPYGTPWAPGDVIGVCADMENGQLSFVKNGTNMGGDRSFKAVFGAGPILQLHWYRSGRFSHLQLLICSQHLGVCMQWPSPTFATSSPAQPSFQRCPYRTANAANSISAASLSATQWTGSSPSR